MKILSHVLCLLLTMTVGMQQPVSTGTRLGPNETLSLPKKMVYPVILNYHLWRGMPMVQGMVGFLPEDFAVDTALNACVVTPNACQRWKLPSSQGQMHALVFQQEQIIPSVKAPAIRFNSFTLSEVPVGLLDVFALLAPSHTQNLGVPSGWFGTPFLSAFQPTFNFDRQLIFLEPPNAVLPVGKEVVTAPMDLQDGQPKVMVSLPGARPFPALIATSAPISMIPAKAAQEARLKPLEWLSVRLPDGKLGKAARVVALKMGVKQAVVPETNAVFMEAEGKKGASKQLGILGMDFLRHFRVTLSYSRKTAVFAPIVKPMVKPNVPHPGEPGSSLPTVANKHEKQGDREK